MLLTTEQIENAKQSMSEQLKKRIGFDKKVVDFEFKDIELLIVCTYFFDHNFNYSAWKFEAVDIDGKNVDIDNCDQLILFERN